MWEAVISGTGLMFSVILSSLHATSYYLIEVNEDGSPLHRSSYILFYVSLGLIVALQYVAWFDPFEGVL